MKTSSHKEHRVHNGKTTEQKTNSRNEHDGHDGRSNNKFRSAVVSFVDVVEDGSVVVKIVPVATS